MITNIKTLQKLETEQKQHEYFRTHVTCEMNNNKEEYKFKTLPNGMKITGIGKKCLKIENNFYNWEDIEESAINDTEDEIMQNILAFIFEDYTIEEVEETQVEKNLREKEVKYAEEKAYIYRHILKEDLSVEMIRDIVYDRHCHHTGMNGIEEIINECLQFAFKYQKEVKFTNKISDEGDVTKLSREYCSEEDSNKYAIQNGKSYVYIIKNKEVIYDEEKEAYRFEEYKKVIFKLKGTLIEVYRKGKKVHTQQAGRKQIYIRGTHKRTYELSVEQQLQMMQEQGLVHKVSDEEVQEEFIDFIKNNESEMAYEVREAIGDKKLEHIEEEYDRSLAIQHYAREMYHIHRVHSAKFYHMLNAIQLEDKVNSDLIVDYVLYDDSSFNKATFYEDKYHFTKEPEAYGSKKITLQSGFSSKTYSYMQNCEYTQIEYVESYIDTFAVTTVYLKGDVSEEDAIRLFEYKEGLVDVEMKYGYIYEKEGMKIRY